MVTGAGVATYRLSWTSDQTINNANPYRVYVDGILASKQVGSTFDIRIPSSQNPVIEVLDISSAVPSIAYPGYLELGWQLDTDALQYQISQMNNDGLWVQQAIQNQDLTTAWQTYTTPVLSDQVTAQWKVTPIDSAGNYGVPVSFMVLMVRYPDVPQPLWTYNGSVSKTLTLS